MRHVTWLRRAVWICLLAAVIGMPRASAEAQQLKLTVNGDRFAVNEQEKFLLFVSYFDGLRAVDGTLDIDFPYIKAKGFDGVRIFANWWDDRTSPRRFRSDTVMSRTGLRSARVQRLKEVLDKARSHGLLVDLSLSRETVCDDTSGPILDDNASDKGCASNKRLDFDGFKNQIVSLVGELNSPSYNHVLIDLQNEIDDSFSGQKLTAAQVADIAGAVHTAYPASPLMLTASTTDDTSKEDMAAMAYGAGLNLTAYHDRRSSTWPADTASQVGALRTALKNARPSIPTPLKPIYLQEPERWDHDPVVSKFHTAAKNAKSAGAAAWTFHTKSGFDLTSPNPAIPKTFKAEVLSDNNEKTALEGLSAQVDSQLEWNVCRPSISVSPQGAISSSGGAISVTVTTDPVCGWAASNDNNTSWIQLSHTQGEGNGTVTVTVQPNPNTTARGPVTVTVAGHPVSISQQAAPCSYSLTTANQSLWPSSGGGTITVNTSAGNCAWNASSNVGWLTFAAGTESGTNSGSVTFKVSANHAYAPRTATVTIAGQSVTFTQARRRTLVDFDGDGISDRTIYRASTGNWWIRGRQPVPFGLSNDVPKTLDWDGDGKTDLALYRPSTAEWFVALAANNFAYDNQPIYYWGVPNSSDVPLVGDFDGDGRSEVAIFRPSTATWWIRYPTGHGEHSFGLPTDVPKVADWDGDGRSDLVLYRPSTGAWYVALAANNFAYDNVPFQWGVPGDVPLSGDYNGDGFSDISIYRPSTATWHIAYQNGGTRQQPFGTPSDFPGTLDLDGDGKSDLVLFRNATADWYVALAADNFAYSNTPVQWGIPGDIPIFAH